jgi:hypothetical protein
MSNNVWNRINEMHYPDKEHHPWIYVLDDRVRVEGCSADAKTLYAYFMRGDSVYDIATAYDCQLRTVEACIRWFSSKRTKGNGDE